MTVVHNIRVVEDWLTGNFSPIIFVLSSKLCNLLMYINNATTSKASKQHLFAKSLNEKSVIINILFQAKLLLVLFLTYNCVACKGSISL